MNKIINMLETLNLNTVHEKSNFFAASLASENSDI